MRAVRRVAAVATAGGVPGAQALLDAMPGVDGTAHAAGGTIPLAATDILWLHDTTDDFPDLLAWLQAGGRLLATLGSVHLPHRLGLEPTAPTLLPPPAAGNGAPGLAFRGIAGFGAHPLFAGFQQGFVPDSPAGTQGWRWTGYDGIRPDAGVVGVEWVPEGALAGRVVAWEYAVGSGGILCIGGGVELDGLQPPQASALLALLGNALAGRAIPHRDREGPV
ncbi:MAG TPA: hypothetical protein VFV65_02400, partial [Gemmatimonadales bacterium]|nr:hypothetical protein [Gemmatimonadales bacterium]